MAGGNELSADECSAGAPDTGTGTLLAEAGTNIEFRGLCTSSLEYIYKQSIHQSPRYIPYKK